MLVDAVCSIIEKPTSIRSGKDSQIFWDAAKATRVMPNENADLTIVAAEPRLAPYRLPMREAIARALGVPVASISLKATTTDGLGALGRAEGVLASAAVLLSKDG